MTLSKLKCYKILAALLKTTVCEYIIWTYW